jgi:predicted transcriptional regulator
MPPSDTALLSLAAQIVSAHVESTETQARALPGLIRDVYQALASVVPGAPEPLPPLSEPRTKVGKQSSAQTVFVDRLVCQECGLHMKMLKRHLQSVHNLTPSQYRSKWHLPSDYPMVAQDYAALRSDLAKANGLGRRPITRAR